jgi:hypothetical protein
MRKTLFLLCIFGLPGASLAQTIQLSWANLSALQAGQNIQVTDTASKKHSGTFASASDTALAYRDTSGEHSIQKQDVRSVKLTANKHRGRNTLIGGAVGGAVGAGVGAAIGAATHQGCAPGAFCLDIIGEGGSAGIGAALGFLGGAITGGVVGALLPSHSTIYSVNPP